MKAKLIVLLGVFGVSFSAIFVKYTTAPAVVIAFYRMLFAATFISTAKLGEPVFATVLGIFLFGQIPVAQQVIGAVIILAGLYLYTTLQASDAGE